VTVITNAAREPEIVDLQEYMKKLGVNVSGAGTSTVSIDGFEPRGFVRHVVMPDRIVSATAMCCVAVTGGSVTLRDVAPADFETISAALEYMGCDIERGESTVMVSRVRPLRACYPIITKPYPDFPTDAHTAAYSGLPYARPSRSLQKIFLNRNPAKSGACKS
jgi:UDP-N-acetylglucosamine 1-carboxyvinyltransferase